MDHIASWQVVILERNETRGHTCVRAMATTCPSKSGRHSPHNVFEAVLGALRSHALLSSHTVTETRGASRAFHIKPSRMGMPHASPGDGGRNESDVRVPRMLFFHWRSEPRLANKASTLQPGVLSFPNPHPTLHLRPTRPSGLRGYSIKSKRERAVRCALPFISAGRPSPFGASFLAGRVTGSPGRVALAGG
jgi:hypothetical protein